MKSNRLSVSIFLFIVVFFLFSCEDPITLKSDFESPQLVVDAWINNEAEPQIITLTQSQDYFDNRLPTPIDDAEVMVKNVTNGLTYTFIHTEEGKYLWNINGTETLGNINDEFELNITYNNNNYLANTSINRVPPIDSISIYFENEPPGGEKGLYAQVYARDFVGIGDTYWIRSSRNDTLNNKPQEISIAYDATFDAGTGTDGIYFIFPLRFSINAIADDGGRKSLMSGDKIDVEIQSISNDAFQFLQIVQEQTTNGDNTIFALPVANAVSNITNASTNKRALGFFNVAAVSRASKVVD